ncbi:hypothetical protein LWI29_033600 [Acer saccharum]|uniref:Uncharacterized protein n=1 Tax=Acer saccharum TaxID=4024 RepID=A0AA39RX60_ACESA|nr:hypothetical protein LWI29_033600 [Acer saccharum]
MALQKDEAERKNIHCFDVIENLKKEMIISNVDAELKEELCSLVLHDLEQRKSKFKSSLCRIDTSEMENHRLKDKILSLEACIANLQTDLEMKNAEFSELQHSQADFMEDICLKNRDLEFNMDRAELSRKDDVLEGLSFDLSLLQKSASNTKDQKDEIEEMVASLEALEDYLKLKSSELDQVVAHSQMLESQLQGKINVISTLESNISREKETLKLLSCENMELGAHIEDTSAAKTSINEELIERVKINKSLELEVEEMGNAIGQMNDTIESLRNHLNELTSESDHLHLELFSLNKRREREQLRAKENEATALESQQLAESRKIYVEEKEVEVRLLKRSVEELEHTINVLENKIAQCKAHISELNLHAEAQVSEYKQKIFTLKARLASAESMTHDVIRDLLGVKLDMTNYADQEVIKLKQQLNEFIEEKREWLEEIDRKQAELVTAQIALEKLRQQDQSLRTENEMLKEENNMLKYQNEDLSTKLRRSEVFLSRVKEELAQYRASIGKNPNINFDEEHRLKNKLQETEEERMQLAQKLLGLCTSILKAAGITRVATDISPDVAEEALEQLTNRIISQDRELQNLKFKIIDHKVRGLLVGYSSMEDRSIEIDHAMANEDSTGDVNALQHQIRPLKESTSNTKDKKDEIKEMVASLEALEDDLELKSSELAQVVAHSKRNRLSEIIHLSSPTNTRTDENIHSPTLRHLILFFFFFNPLV